MSATKTPPQEAWQIVLDQLRREMPKATFDNWLSEARFLAFRDGVFTIGARDAYTRTWLESRLTSTIARGLAGILNSPVEVRFALWSPENQDGEAIKGSELINQPGRNRDRPLRLSPEGAWAAVGERLKRSIAADDYERWVKGIKFLAYYQDTYILSLPTGESRDWVEKTLGGPIAHTLNAIVQGDPVKVQFVVLPDQGVDAPAPALIPADPWGAGEDSSSDKDSASPAGGLTEEEAEVLIKPIRVSLREIITRPKSVVVVSAYLLRWLPYLGVDKGWFVLAMRQAFYQANGEKVGPDNCGRTFAVSRRRIARWSGLGDKKTWELLKSLDREDLAGNFLAWFIKRLNVRTLYRPVQDGAFKRANVYAFRADMPLTPGDAESLHAWLIENGLRENPIETLQKALELQPRELLPHPALPPEERHFQMAPQPQTVQDVVLAAAGIPLAAAHYLPVKRLAGELQTHLQSPSDNILLTHYFLLEWLTKLGRIPGWIVTILRDRGYIDHIQGIRRDRIALKNGYAELAQLLNVSERQVESWLPPLGEMVRRKKCNSERSVERPEQQADIQPSDWAKHQAKRSLVGLFLEKDGDVDWSGIQTTQYEFKVRFEDPLTPEHQEIYDALEGLLHEGLLARDRSGVQALAVALESAPSLRTGSGYHLNPLMVSGPGLRLIRESHDPSRAWSAKNTTEDAPDPQRTQVGETSVREQHEAWSAKHAADLEADARIAQLKALLIKHLNPKALLEIKQLLQEYLEEISPDRASPPAIGVVGAAGYSSWDWDKLLGYSGVPDDVRAEIMGSSEIQRHFLGHAFYGYEHRAIGGNKGIQTPFKYAASRRLDCPPPEYMELAGMPPDELITVISEGNRYEVARSVSDSAFRVATALRENDFLMVIESAARVQPRPVQL